MFRPKPIEDAASAAEYFGKGDAGYYLDGSGLWRKWGGEESKRLGLTGAPTQEQLERLLAGFDPHTGEQLTAMLTDDRVPGWTFTASVPKGVTAAIERGDTRVRELLWEAGNSAMEDVQDYAKTRVRKGGRDDDRLTGGIGFLGVEHRETRPVEDESLPEDHPWRLMPDWDRHLHFIVWNSTFDPVEQECKALKVRQIFDLKKWFDRRFDARVAAGLAELGYETETKMQATKDGMRYYTWDIKAAPGHEAGWQSANAKNSRRSGEIEDAEQQVLADIKARDPDAPDALSAVARDNLGATSRLGKRKDLTQADLDEFWDARLTPAEKTAIDATIERARLGLNPSPQPRAAEAMDYAIRHHFERSSVVDWHDLAVTAMEKSMGAARPEDFEREALARRGVLFQGDKASTKEVLAQEQRIIDFARAGKGVFRPLAAGRTEGLENLADEQANAARHVWNSPDQMMVVRGGAGTGKTTMMTPVLGGLSVPKELLAPSAEAARGELRDSGFKTANTVASFLVDEKRQEGIRGGVIWVDEAGMLSIDDLERLCSIAKEKNARLVLQGDPKQHTSVQRHGNMLNVLEEYAGLPVARLTKIQRQKGDYAKAVAAIERGDVANGDDVLTNLGWMVEGQGHDALIAEYAKAIEEKKPNGELKTVLVVDPTHKDGDALTEKLRALLKERELVGQEEKTFPRLVAIDMTVAQRGDASQYAGDEIIQFFHDCGNKRRGEQVFKAGERVKASEVMPHLVKLNPKHFAPFRETEVSFSVGDTLRTTNGGKDTGGHRIDNGRVDVINGFTKNDGIILSNGWVLPKDFGHLKHGLVRTSVSTQSRTHDIVLAAMNKASLGATNHAQAYVTASRGRERGMIFTDMPREERLKAMARLDQRKSATELFYPKPVADAAAKEESRTRSFMEKVRRTYRQFQRKAAAVVQQTFKPKEMGYAR